MLPTSQHAREYDPQFRSPILESEIEGQPKRASHMESDMNAKTTMRRTRLPIIVGALCLSFWALTEAGDTGPTLGPQQPQVDQAPAPITPLSSGEIERIKGESKNPLNSLPAKGTESRQILGAGKDALQDQTPPVLKQLDTELRGYATEVNIKVYPEFKWHEQDDKGNRSWDAWYCTQPGDRDTAVAEVHITINKNLIKQRSVPMQWRTRLVSPD